MSQKNCKISKSDLSHKFAKLHHRESYGRLFAYDKSYDRITTKTERPLQLVDRIKYNTTTSDDPVIQEVMSSFLTRNYRI